MYEPLFGLAQGSLPSSKKQKVDTTKGYLKNPNRARFADGFGCVEICLISSGYEAKRLLGRIEQGRQASAEKAGGTHAGI